MCLSIYVPNCRMASKITKVLWLLTTSSKVFVSESNIRGRRCFCCCCVQHFGFRQVITIFLICNIQSTTHAKLLIHLEFRVFFNAGAAVATFVLPLFAVVDFTLLIFFDVSFLNFLIVGPFQFAWFSFFRNTRANCARARSKSNWCRLFLANDYKYIPEPQMWPFTNMKHTMAFQPLTTYVDYRIHWNRFNCRFKWHWLAGFWLGF